MTKPRHTPYLSVTDQPGVGTLRVDNLGRTWRKVRMLPDLDWESVVLDGIASARIYGITGNPEHAATDGQIERMGYNLVPEKEKL